MGILKFDLCLVYVTLLFLNIRKISLHKMNLKSTLFNTLRDALFGRADATPPPLNNSQKQFLAGRHDNATGQLLSPNATVNSEPFVGDIMLFAGNFPPQSHFFCHGQVLAIAQYSSLFALLGTTYGGNGQTTFALPDLRSRIPIHVGNGYVLGQNGGAATTTLTAANIPTVAQSTVQAKVRSVGTAVVGVTDGGLGMATTTLNSNGTATAVNNLPPFTCINFCIAYQGIFPSET